MKTKKVNIRLVPVLLVKDYLRKWLHDYGKNLAENTLRGYRVNVENHIIPYIGDLELAALRPLHIHEMYIKLSDSGLSGTTCKYVHATLHRALKTAVQLELISYNPADKVDVPRKDRPEIVALNVEQCKQLLSMALLSEIYIPVLLGVCCGLRRGEVCGLRWEDVDFRANLISIRHTANYSGGFHLVPPKSRESKRTLVMPSMVASALMQEKEAQLGYENEFDTVCIRSGGTPLYPKFLQSHFKMLLEDAGLPDIRFHDLRHTNATLLLRASVPPKVVSAMLGHSSIGLTMDTYSHVYPDMQAGAVASIDELFNAG